MTSINGRPVIRRVRARSVPHGFRPDLVVTLHGDGTVEVRELRRREPPIILDLGTLYARARVRVALQNQRKGGKP